MPVVSLPLTFNNSFWSKDYRHGLEVLYTKLQEGCAENDEIVNFVKARAQAERTLASSLTNPPATGPRGTGFDIDDGASLLMAFKGLQAESRAQGEIHKTFANDLEKLIVEPFSQWAAKHKDRVYDSRAVMLDGWLTSFEEGKVEVAKLQGVYQAKVRRADEAEDDAKFSMGGDVVGDKDKYTSPVKTSQTNGVVNRSNTMSEMIAQRFSALRQGTIPSTTPEPPKEEVKAVVVESQTTRSPEPIEKELPKVDKGKGREIDPEAAPPTTPKIEIPENPAAESQVVLAGLPLRTETLNALIEKAKKELPLRPIRFPLIGEYKDCFSGLEFLHWITNNVQGLNGDEERAELFATEMAERESLLRRLGELGNKFESSPDAYFQFRNKLSNAKRTTLFSPVEAISPTLAPAADNIMKRSKGFLSVVQQVVGGGGTNEPIFIRTRREAEAAEKEYQIAVRKLDRQRLGLEERIEDTLKVLQKWEAERLRALKTVLLQYQGTVASHNSSYQASLDKSATLLTSFQPDQDLMLLMERYRTGPFAPSPQVFESVDRERDVVFGIDLRQWAGEGGWNAVRNGEKEKPQVPAVLSSLLSVLKEAYPKIESQKERRKAWIYDVPLLSVHRLRETINSLPLDKPIDPEVLTKFDTPVIASAVKLWFLELDPPVGTWDGWDDIRKLYPTVGTKREEEDTTTRIEGLKGALIKLPRVHLAVLDALIAHLEELTDTTEVEDESKELWMNKVALALGRAILRPKNETEITIQDRHSTLLIMDLIAHYGDILPPTLAQKKRESDNRPMPQRKRTRPVDIRMSRSRLSVGADPRKILEAQLEAKGGRSRNASPEKVPPVPSIPAVAAPAPIAIPDNKDAASEEQPTPKAQTFEEKESNKPSDGGLPPRPMFVEPPPEGDDQSSKIVVSPPTPSPATDENGTGEDASPRSASPARSDDAGSPGGSSSLKRTTSGEATRVRGPRTARGPRPPGPSHSSSKSSVTNSADFAPRKHGGHTAAGAFSRRTQESDAEDDVVGR